MIPTSPRKVSLPSSGPEARASTEERPRATGGPPGAMSPQAAGPLRVPVLICLRGPAARPAGPGTGTQTQPDQWQVRLQSAGGIHPHRTPTRGASWKSASWLFRPPLWPPALLGEQLPGKKTCRRALRVTGAVCWLVLALTPGDQCSQGGCREN